MTGAPLPKVTCVVCAYNYDAYIAEALDSALAQDYPADRLEILVIDDGSTDATPEILAGYGDRIRVIRQENAGLNAATERGVREATGDLVALLDADDVWLPHKLRHQVALLQRRPEVGLVYSDMELMNAGGTVYARSYFDTYHVTPARGPHALGELIRANTVPAPTILFRRALAEQVLPIAPEASFQDWWLGVRIAEIAEIDCVRVALVRYRIHGSNMAAASGGDKLLGNLRADVVFRRWMLRTLDLSAMDPAELRGVWKSFIDSVAFLAERAGSSLAAELEVAEEDRAEARDHAARARGAAPGELQAAVRALLAARACDPFDSKLKRDMRSLLARHEAEPAAVLPAAAGTPAERLAWAEERYAEGGVDAAIEALISVADDAVGMGEPDVAGQAHADLAVIAFELGDARSARRAAQAALRHAPDCVAALEILGRSAAAGHDRIRAAYWLGRAAAADPSDPTLWRAVGAARFDLARWSSATEAYETAAAIEPLPVEDAERLGRALASCSPAPAPGAPREGAGRVLICVDLFHPSVGGTERLAEGVGTALQGLGWEVEVACRADVARTARRRNGMAVHEIRRKPREELRKVVARGRFDAVLAIGDPFAWPVTAALHLPKPGPRTVVVPCMNAENTHTLRQHAHLMREWRELLERADTVVQSSFAGFDARLLADLGMAGEYVPNAIEEVQPAGSLHTLLGLDPDRPTLLCVSNLYPYKNHAGLLELLGDRPGDWQLVIAGHPAPDFPEEAVRVERLAAADPRVRLVRGLPPELVAAGLREADLFVLPSLNDATPLVVLEAMSHGVPWIATQHCGAVHDWSGGLVLDLDDVGDGIDHLLADATARAILGAAGRAHWEACFTWPTVARRYDALLRGARTLEPLPGPRGAEEETDAARAEFYDRSIRARAIAG